MINLNKLTPILNGYKAYFPIHWSDEKYKWEAVKHFQVNWDIDAENFGDMFKKATGIEYEKRNELNLEDEKAVKLSLEL